MLTQVKEVQDLRDLESDLVIGLGVLVKSLRGE